MSESIDKISKRLASGCYIVERIGTAEGVSPSAPTSQFAVLVREGQMEGDPSEVWVVLEDAEDRRFVEALVDSNRLDLAP
jgi:hypothetical protein